MYFLSFIAYAADAASEVTQTATRTDMVIGIGDIAVNFVVGIVSILITLLLTLKTIKQLKLSYSIHIYQILSKSLTDRSNIADLEIKYKNEKLKNPCLLTVEIVNTGNKSIINPPIKIRSNHNIGIIPGYFEDIPNGYENMWSMNLETANCCSLSLEHINPKQVVKARFFLDEMPQDKIIFECPMADMQLQEITYDVKKESSSKINFKANYILIAITILMFSTIGSWAIYLSELIWISGLRIPSYLAAAFIMGVLILAIIFNLCGINWLDDYVRLNRKRNILFKISLFILSCVILYLITFDILIVKAVSQIIAGIISLLLLALLIHISMISYKE